MDLKDQLSKLFPDHQPSEEAEQTSNQDTGIWIQDEAIICRYEKRRGKAHTILEGYNGATEDFKQLTKEIKKKLGVGGSYKDDKIIIQGDYRDEIMQFLKQKGFKVKRSGG